MNMNNAWTKILLFVLGGMAVVLLSGAKSTDQSVEKAGAEVGRYQMEVVVRDRITRIYVMDTTTGAVKWVDSMNTPFTDMKGD